MTFALCTSSVFLKLSRRLSLWLRPEAAGCYMSQVHYLDIGVCVCVSVCVCLCVRAGVRGSIYEGFKDKCKKKRKRALCSTIKWACPACSVSWATHQSCLCLTEMRLSIICILTIKKLGLLKIPGRRE